MHAARDPSVLTETEATLLEEAHGDSVLLLWTFRNGEPQPARWVRKREVEPDPRG